jgi:ketosteroid isomerase-like protein
MPGTALAIVIQLLAAGVSPTVQDQNAVRMATEKQAAAFSAAFNRGDVKAIAAMYTEDAIALPPDAELVRGRAAIEKLWADAMASGIKTITFTVLDVQSSGEFAVETGRAVLGVQPAGAQSQRRAIVVNQST